MQLYNNLSAKERAELTMKEYAVKNKLLNEIGLLEKKWGLI